MAWFMGFDRAVEIEWVVTKLVWIQIGWFGGGVVIHDGGVMGGERVGLLIWVQVCCHGCGFGFTAVGCGDRGLLFYFYFILFLWC